MKCLVPQKSTPKMMGRMQYSSSWCVNQDEGMDDVYGLLITKSG